MTAEVYTAPTLCRAADAPADNGTEEGDGQCCLCDFIYVIITTSPCASRSVNKCIKEAHLSIVWLSLSGRI